MAPDDRDGIGREGALEDRNLLTEVFGGDYRAFLRFFLSESSLLFCHPDGEDVVRGRVLGASTACAAEYQRC